MWFDKESGNIAKAQLTIREYTGGLIDEGAISFADYKRVGDVLIPTKIDALFAIDGDSIRTWNVDHFAWTDAKIAGPAPLSGEIGASSQPASQASL